jgi:hypothetical protein
MKTLLPGTMHKGKIYMFLTDINVTFTDLSDIFEVRKAIMKIKLEILLRRIEIEADNSFLGRLIKHKERGERIKSSSFKTGKEGI